MIEAVAAMKLGCLILACALIRGSGCRLLDPDSTGETDIDDLWNLVWGLAAGTLVSCM